MTDTKIGRPCKPPPPDAAERIQALAADGWSKRGVANALGTSFQTLDKWLEEDPALLEAFENGRENERHALHNMLYREAIEKRNVTAAAILLNARHGYRTDAQDVGNKVSLTFNLPGAMPMNEFLKLKEVTGNDA